MNTYTVVGVDVSKATLEVKSNKLHFSVSNTEKGINEMFSKLKGEENMLLVCEASGGYERLVIHKAHLSKIPIHCANAARVRAFAKSEGIRAKSDPIDAEMIRRYGVEKTLAPTPPPNPVSEKMANLLDRHNQLSKLIASEKNRLQNSPKIIHKSIIRIMKALECELKRINEEIKKAVASDEVITKRVKCIQETKGMGPVVAWHIVAYLNEITQLKRNQAVAMAGLAPYNKDSGTMKGKRRIEGGRGKVRNVLFMAAQSAAVHNPVIREYVKGLRDREKPYKSAIVAAMRKLLIHVRSELKKSELELAF